MEPADLPEHLHERIRIASASSPARDGEFVLYWMHHAVRDQENPALDAALHAAELLKRPLLVYQGLGGGHRYDSDRHHAIIVEGARDVAEALAKRGVRYTFHLGTKPGMPSPLHALATRAALVVTEDLPAPPFPQWTSALAQRARGPLWLVDTACVLPMRLVGRAFDRAFEFRRAWGKELERRAALPWPPVLATPRPFEGEVGFDPIDLASCDIAALCAACPIDHSIGPAPETRGGQRAGKARWQAFKASGLASYDTLRNDALVSPPRGVSRISPYLHHGHLSPLQIAREAHAHGSSGARKFLDELLIWRELAHNFCFQLADDRARLESLAALPQWARETLVGHEGDPREADYSWEVLARGDTKEALWDAAQTWLRVHGELHNNVRMTWGKALLRWCRSPQHALELMIDLNHRYALDGNDPNSYGGLLWCLGLFDRPFKPAQSIYGTVRARPAGVHARRLDVAAYLARARARTSLSVGVVGAGIAGLAAARTLADLGFEATVLERAHAVGGRAASRTAHGHTFDHGAQYFTARDPLFQRYLESWIQLGIAAPWEGVIDRDSGDPSSGGTRYAGVPTMRAVAEHLAGSLDIRLGVQIDSVACKNAQWQIAGERFGALVLALPPEQATPLLSAFPTITARVATIKSLPCWSAMVAFETRLELPFDAAFVEDSPLAWVARDSSKPGRARGERWVLHATPEWSGARLDEERDIVADRLIQAFFDAFELPPVAPLYRAGHRWRYARVPEGIGENCVWDAALGLAVCGDWCRSARVEDAFLSGVAAAGRIAGTALIQPASENGRTTGYRAGGS